MLNGFQKREPLEVSNQTNSFIKCVKLFFIENNFKEVSTPLILESPLPEPFINAIPAPGGGFFRTSPELHLKILLAHNKEDIFEIGECRRADEKGRLHKESFTMLEWYKVQANYKDLIPFTKKLLLNIAEELYSNTTIEYNDVSIELDSDWLIISVQEAFDIYGTTSLDDALQNDLYEEQMSFHIEPALPKNVPVVLYDYPMEFAALSKQSALNEKFCERWELYLAGIEIANTYTELTDIDEHLCRFDDFLKLRASNGFEEYFLMDSFRKALEIGIPESSGCALGLDRLFMIFFNMKSIPDFTLT